MQRWKKPRVGWSPRIYIGLFFSVRAGAAIGFFLGGGDIPARKACQNFARSAKNFLSIRPPKNSFRPPQQAIFGGGEMSLGGGENSKILLIFLKYLVKL